MCADMFDPAEPDADVGCHPMTSASAQHYPNLIIEVAGWAANVRFLQGNALGIGPAARLLRHQGGHHPG